MSYGKHAALTDANLALNNTFIVDRLMNWELARVKRRKQITNTQSRNRINERVVNAQTLAWGTRASEGEKAGPILSSA